MDGGFRQELSLKGPFGNLIHHGNQKPLQRDSAFVRILIPGKADPGREVLLRSEKGGNGRAEAAGIRRLHHKGKCHGGSHRAAGAILSDLYQEIWQQDSEAGGADAKERNERRAGVKRRKERTK